MSFRDHLAHLLRDCVYSKSPPFPPPPLPGVLERLDSKPMLKTLKQPEFRWPVVGDGLGGEYRWSAGQWSLLKTLADMRNVHSKSVLVRLYVSPDDKNSSHYVIKVRRLRPLSLVCLSFSGKCRVAEATLHQQTHRLCLPTAGPGVSVSALQGGLHHQQLLRPGGECLFYVSAH